MILLDEIDAGNRLRDANMLMYEQAVEDLAIPSPESPPGMTASKSSKSSSFHSLSSDDNSVLSDVHHFEDIGLDDDAISYDRDADVKSLPSRFKPSFSSDLRAASQKSFRSHISKDLAKTRALRDGMPTSKIRPAFPSLQHHVRNINVRSTSTGALVPEPLPHRNLGAKSAAVVSIRSRRSPSPSISLSPRDPSSLVKPRRRSWQSNRERKTVFQLELECDEDEGDDIPEGLVLDNVPISPRPPYERSTSQPGTKTTSPDRAA